MRASNDKEITETVQDRPPEIAVRIPGAWSQLEALEDALPDGCILHRGRLVLPGGAGVEVLPQPPDGEFPGIFAMGCRQSLTAEQKRALAAYTVNICLAAPGGSAEAVRRMFDASAAVVRAGGLGVFVDNSGVAHRADGWLEITGCPAVSESILSIISVFAGAHELSSIGMHMIGMRDAVITRTGDCEVDCDTLNDFLMYALLSENPISDGDLVGDDEGPKYLLRRELSHRFPARSPLHNPYGQWRLQPLPQRAD